MIFSEKKCYFLNLSVLAGLTLTTAVHADSNANHQAATTDSTQQVSEVQPSLTMISKVIIALLPSVITSILRTQLQHLQVIM